MPTNLQLTHQIFSSDAIPAIHTTYVPSKRAFMCARERGGDKGTPRRRTARLWTRRKHCIPCGLSMMENAGIRREGSRIVD